MKFYLTQADIAPFVEYIEDIVERNAGKMYSRMSELNDLKVAVANMATDFPVGSAIAFLPEENELINHFNSWIFATSFGEIDGIPVRLLSC